MDYGSGLSSLRQAVTNSGRQQRSTTVLTTDDDGQSMVAVVDRNGQSVSGE